MPDLEQILSGGDLRSIGKSNAVVLEIKDQQDFDALFELLFHPDRLVVMRAADALEKITQENPSWLLKHKNELMELCFSAQNKELKWHLALLITRIPAKEQEFETGWELLRNWALDKKNSRIVRVNSIQGLFELSKQNPDYVKEFKLILSALEQEGIASIAARIRIIRKQLDI